MLHYFDNKNIDIQTENGTAVALGKFDGFHIGHMLLIDEVMSLQNKGYTGVIFTFDMKRNSVFNVDNMQNIISSDEKRELAEKLGLNVLVEYPFDDEFAGMEPEEFVRDILAVMLHAKFIIVGEDYRFGRNRAGDINFLKKFEEKYGYSVISVDKKKIGDITVSSSYIRSLINVGNVSDAAKFLGRAYSMTGGVVHGRELGRTIQVPTANILPQKGKIYPTSGVYASKIYLHDGRTFYGITNIGDNPTVSDERRVTIETHIFDFSENIYGKKIKVELLYFIRPEKKFKNIDELKNQMLADINFAKNLFCK